MAAITESNTIYLTEKRNMAGLEYALETSEPDISDYDNVYILPKYEKLNVVLGVDINSKVRSFVGKSNLRVRKLTSYSNEQGILMYFLSGVNKQFKPPAYNAQGYKVSLKDFEEHVPILKLALNTKDKYWELALELCNSKSREAGTDVLKFLQSRYGLMIPITSDYLLPKDETLDKILGIDVSVSQKLKEHAEKEKQMRPISFEDEDYFRHLLTDKALERNRNNIFFYRPQK